MPINIQQDPFGLIYKTTNLVNGKIYIGQTVNVKRYLSGNKFKIRGDDPR